MRPGSDDDAFLGESSAHQDLGVIELSLTPIEVLHDTVLAKNHDLAAVKVHERAKKAVTQQITSPPSFRAPPRRAADHALPQARRPRVHWHRQAEHQDRPAQGPGPGEDDVQVPLTRCVHFLLVLHLRGLSDNCLAIRYPAGERNRAPAGQAEAQGVRPAGAQLDARRRRWGRTGGAEPSCESALPRACIPPQAPHAAIFNPCRTS
jgi:hypothetical protein